MNRSSVALFTLLLLSGLCLAAAQSALGEPKTIVVPDDYTSIQDAISNASDGDTIFVKGGTYQERQLVINTTLTLIGENPSTTKIVLSPPVGPYGPLGTFGIDYPIKIEAKCYSTFPRSPRLTAHKLMVSWPNTLTILEE